MSASMAEVLVAHTFAADDICGCTCDEMFYDWRRTPEQVQVEHSLHVEERLAANGYGKLEDAKSAALREAALELMNVSEHDSRMPGIRFAVGFLAGQRRPE